MESKIPYLNAADYVTPKGKYEKTKETGTTNYNDMMNCILEAMRRNIFFDDIIMLLVEFNMDEEAGDIERANLRTQHAIQKGWQKLVSLGSARFNPTTLREALTRKHQYLLVEILEELCHEKHYDINIQKTSDN